MATVLKCKAEHTPLPLGLAVLSSTMIDGTDALKAYAGTASIEDPLVNPVLGDFNGLRHMFAQMGANEASIGDPIKLLERSNQFAARMALSTVKFEYHIGAGLDHVFSEDFSLYPEADEGFEQLLEFLSRTLNLTEQK